MKSKKIKKITFGKKITVPVVVFAFVVIATLSSTGQVSAKQSWLIDDSVDSTEEKVLLSFLSDDIKTDEKFDESKLKNHGENKDDANRNGNLTSEQRFAVLEKYEELEGKLDNLYNLSREDMREMRADINDEMEIWAQKNNIDLSKFSRMFI